jgi:hypothetical protein
MPPARLPTTTVTGTRDPRMKFVGEIAARESFHPLPTG